ncbi:MAG: hypothetical protein KDJ77_16870 [Rhodobiaceae bacterium]|nr:hypothetical protein [Rhodobiaceae bacterium]
MTKDKTAPVITLALLLAGATPSLAGEADVVGVDVRPEGGGRYTVSATVRHDDTGWDHYADAFEVLAPDGAVLGTRVLVHPHETEQPFTRSLTGVAIPEGITEITVRAHDKVHGLGGQEVTVSLPDRPPS